MAVKILRYSTDYFNIFSNKKINMVGTLGSQAEIFPVVIRDLLGKQKQI